MSTAAATARRCLTRSQLGERGGAAEGGFIGVVAPEENGAPSSPPSPPAAAERAAAKVKWSPTRITWDEATAANDATPDSPPVPEDRAARNAVPLLQRRPGNRGRRQLLRRRAQRHRRAVCPSTPTTCPTSCRPRRWRRRRSQRRARVRCRSTAAPDARPAGDGRRRPRRLPSEVRRWRDGRLLRGEAPGVAERGARRRASAGLPEVVAQPSTSSRARYFVHEASAQSQWERPTRRRRAGRRGRCDIRTLD